MNHIRADHVCQLCKMPMHISSSCQRFRGRPVSQAVTASLSQRRSGLHLNTLRLGFVLQEVALVQVFSVEFRFFCNSQPKNISYSFNHPRRHIGYSLTGLLNT
jgi:hypothetical protein